MGSRNPRNVFNEDMIISIQQGNIPCDHLAKARIKLPSLPGLRPGVKHSDLYPVLPGQRAKPGRIILDRMRRNYCQSAACIIHFSVMSLSASRCAKASMVRVGLECEPVGNTAVLQTYRLSYPHTMRSLFTTPFSAASLMRTPPI